MNDWRKYFHNLPIIREAARKARWTIQTRGIHSQSIHARLIMANHIDEARYRLIEIRENGPLLPFNWGPQLLTA